MSHRFRTAEFADAQALSELVNSGYRGERSKKGWTTEADLLGGQRIDVDRLQEMIAEPNARIELLCEAWTEERSKERPSVASEILGCVYLRNEGNGACYLGMLTVLPETQARGLGKELLLHSEAVAREWGCDRIRMVVIDRRDELISYYERRGYVRTGGSEPFPEVDPRFGLPKVSGLRLDELVKRLESL
jgi:ribosomal protein S18 acetylase RimI-like enzyme